MTEISDDAELVRRIAARDAEALGELYDRHGRVVFAVVYRMVGASDAAEEVTQDVFPAVWRRIGTYRADRGAFRGWLLTIARNAAIDWQRTKRKRYEREAPIDEAFTLADDVRVEEQVTIRLRDVRVRAAVEALSPEQRETLDLAFWQGLSQTEIATRTGVPLGTVKSRVRLAMAKLRDGLAAEGKDA